MALKNKLIKEIVNLLEEFYCSKISVHEFGKKLEIFWKNNKDKKIILHPIYDIHLIGELYLDYDSFSEKPDYKNFEINKRELKIRCIETVKVIVLIEPQVRKYLNYPEILDQKLSLKQIENRLSKNGRILIVLRKKVTHEENLIIIWINLDKQTNNYFASIENWPLNFNEKKERYPKAKEYRFSNLNSLFNYLKQKNIYVT